MSRLSLFPFFVLAIAGCGDRDTESDTAPPDASGPAVCDNAVRAVWIDYRSHCTTDAECTESMGRLREQGFNRVYVQAFNNGIAFFESPHMRSFAGPEAVGQPLIRRVLDSVDAIGGGIEVWAWFEYGLIAEYSTCTRSYCQAADAEGWLLGQTSNGFQWLDARMPAVRAHIVSLLADLAESDPRLAGIQLDDHFALPTELAGADTETMTAFAGQVLAASTTAIALAPATLSFSRDELNVDWGAWAEGGLSGARFDHYAVQMYRRTFDAFEPELALTTGRLAGACDLVVGLRCQGSGDETTWAELAPMIETTAARSDLSGMSIWYSPCSLDRYASEWSTLEGW